MIHRLSILVAIPLTIGLVLACLTRASSAQAGTVSNTLTLGFNGGSQSLPWSEQGFTFDGDNYSTVQESLVMTSYGGFFPFTGVSLTRAGGAPFDAVSLDVDFFFTVDGCGEVYSNLGGYVGIGSSGTYSLTGPEWVGITNLTIWVYGFGDGGGVAAQLIADDFVVRVPSGTSYCTSTTNSTGQAATISASGSSNLAANDLVLHAVGVPDAPFIFFHAALQTQIPFGDGFLCAGGNLVRIAAAVASGGVAEAVVDLPLAGITSPGPRNFQCWFRDCAAGGAGFNTSDSLEITFVP